MAARKVTVAAIDNNQDYGDHGQGEGNRHNGLLAHNLGLSILRSPHKLRLAILAAMGRASSRVSRLAARRPGSSWF